MNKITPLFVFIASCALWPPAGTMEKPHKHKYTYQETINYIKMNIDTFQEEYPKLSIYTINNLYRDLVYKIFIKKYVCETETKNRIFDLDVIDQIILKEKVNLFDQNSTIFTLDMEN